SEIKDYDQMNPDLFEGLNIPPANENTEVVDDSSLEIETEEIETNEIETEESSDLQEDNVVPFSN
ncbi:MAG: hypothetical protein ACKVHQ_08570, partial [Gammaproteobacteria bacterium]